MASVKVCNGPPVWMSVVHYKFGSELNYAQVEFVGKNITVRALKAAIVQQNRIGANLDLTITDAHTKETYSEDEAVIGKNTRVKVLRIPAPKRSKNQRYREPKDYSDDKQTADLAGMDIPEREKIATMMKQSTAIYRDVYDEEARWKKGPRFPGDPVPEKYVCNLCYKPDHWINHCVLRKYRSAKRGSGIPKSKMIRVEGPDVPGAMLMVDGTFGIPAINYYVQLEEKIEKEKRVQARRWRRSNPKSAIDDSKDSIVSESSSLDEQVVDFQVKNEQKCQNLRSDSFESTMGDSKDSIASEPSSFDESESVSSEEVELVIVDEPVEASPAETRESSPISVSENYLQETEESSSQFFETSEVVKANADSTTTEPSSDDATICSGPVYEKYWSYEHNGFQADYHVAEPAADAAMATYDVVYQPYNRNESESNVYAEPVADNGTVSYNSLYKWPGYNGSDDSSYNPPKDDNVCSEPPPPGTEDSLVPSTFDNASHSNYKQHEGYNNTREESTRKRFRDFDETEDFHHSKRYRHAIHPNNSYDSVNFNHSNSHQYQPHVQQYPEYNMQQTGPSWTAGSYEYPQQQYHGHQNHWENRRFWHNKRFHDQPAEYRGHIGTSRQYQRRGEIAHHQQRYTGRPYQQPKNKSGSTLIRLR